MINLVILIIYFYMFDQTKLEICLISHPVKIYIFLDGGSTILVSSQVCIPSQTTVVTMFS